MVAPLQYLDVETVESASSTAALSGGSTAPAIKLTTGSNFQPGDLRLIFVLWFGGSSGGSGFAAVTSSTGYTAAGTFTSTFTMGKVYYRKMQAGDVDSHLVFTVGDGLNNVCYNAVTVRNWDPAQTLSASASGIYIATSGWPPSTLTITAPSVSVTAGGSVLNCYQSLSMQIQTSPPGETELGATAKSGSKFLNDPYDFSSITGVGCTLNGQTYSSNGTSGTKAVTIGNNPDSITPGTNQAVAWAIALNQAPDLTFAVAGVTETDTPGAITLATTGATSFPVAAVTETDTPGVILFKTQSQWTDWDILPGHPVQNSLLTWTVIPGSAGSTVTVKTSIDNGATWQLAVNGGPIPNLNKGNTTATSVGYQITETRINAGDTPAQVSDFWPRIAVDDGYDEMLPLGTFVINAQDVVESGGSSGGGAGGSGGAGSSGVAGGGGTTAGGGMAVTLTAPDYSYIISRRTWDDVFFVAGGTNVMDAVAQIARNRMPDVKLNLGSTPHTLQGPMVFGSDQGQNDPWNDLKELVASIGWEIYFNVWGELTTRPTPDPATDAPVWTISDGSDGNRPTICGYTKTVDDATTFSHVIAQGESTNNPSGLPVMAEWFNIDPASNTNIYSDFGDVTTVYQSVLLGTTVQCQQAADAIGRFSSGTEETLKLDHLPVPFLEQSDLVTVVRPLAGISGVYQINGWTFPLGPNGVQSSDIYRQKAG